MELKTRLLKIALLGLGAFILMLGFIMTMSLINEGLNDLNIYVWIFVISLAASGVIGLWVLYYLYQIVDLIQENTSFSEETLRLVAKVKHRILAASITFLGILPFVAHVADTDDAPGLILIGLGLVAIPFVAYVFSLIVEELFKNAIHLKSEQDLTI